jgi:hypothetical protein
MGNKILTLLSEQDRDDCDPVPQDAEAGQRKSTPPKRRKKRKLAKKADVIPAFLPQHRRAMPKNDEEQVQESEPLDLAQVDSPEEDVQESTEAGDALSENTAPGAENDNSGGEGTDEGGESDEEETPPLAAQAPGTDTVSDPELIELLEQLSATIDSANQVLAETPALGDIPEHIDGLDSEELKKPDVPEAWTLAQKQAAKPNKRILTALVASLLMAGAGAAYWWVTADSPVAGDGAALRTAAAEKQESVSLKIPVPAVAIPVPLPARKPEPPADTADAAAADAGPIVAASLAAPGPSPAAQTPAIAAPSALTDIPAAAESAPKAELPAAAAFEPPADDEAVAINEALATPAPREDTPAIQRGYPGQPIALDLATPQPQNGAEVSVMIRGLPKDTKLSAGSLIGNGTWVLEHKDTIELALLTPETFSPQEFALDVSYVKSDGKVPESRSIRVVVEPAQPPVRPATHGLAAADAGNTPAAQVSALAVRGPVPGGTAPVDSADPAPAQSAESAQPSISREEEDALIGKGDKLLKLGDVASARLIFEHAARRGSTSAMIKLGKTYDPQHLSALGVQGVQADITQARAWYERASRKADR